MKKLFRAIVICSSNKLKVAGKMDGVKQRCYNTRCGIKQCKTHCKVVEQAIINDATHLDPFGKLEMGHFSPGY